MWPRRFQIFCLLLMKRKVQNLLRHTGIGALKEQQQYLYNKRLCARFRKQSLRRINFSLSCLCHSFHSNALRSFISISLRRCKKDYCFERTMGIFLKKITFAETFESLLPSCRERSPLFTNDVSWTWRNWKERNKKSRIQTSWIFNNQESDNQNFLDHTFKSGRYFLGSNVLVDFVEISRRQKRLWQSSKSTQGKFCFFASQTLGRKLCFSRKILRWQPTRDLINLTLEIISRMFTDKTLRQQF